MKVLVLTSSTGGGHDMRARSLKAWAETEEAKPMNLRVDIFQALEETHNVYRLGVSIYNWIQTHHPRLHHIYFNMLELMALHRSPGTILGKNNFVQKLQAFCPDVIVSTHAHLNHGFFELARSVLGKHRIKCVTYCGELYGGYGFSRHWVNAGADLFIGAVKETCLMAERLGMVGKSNAQGGFLLNPRFYQKQLAEHERKRILAAEFGLDPDGFTIVLATGANSANNHVSLLNALANASLRVGVIALCGKSYHALVNVRQWAETVGHKAGIQARAIPYSVRLDELFQVASVVVARPGTGTTSECIQCECPILFNALGGIMPQEYITVKYAREHGFLGVIKTPKDLPRLIEPIMQQTGIREANKNALKRVKPAQHPMDILRMLYGCT